MKFAEIELRDSWDCMVAYVRDLNGPHGLAQKDILYELREKRLNLGKSTSWLEDFLVPHAALTRTGKVQAFDRQISEFQIWMENLEGFDPDKYSEFRKRFFGNAIDLGERSYKFIGRTDDLDCLEKFFNSESQPGKKQQSVTLHERQPLKLRAPKAEGVTTLAGFGGQGKTALAFEYADRFRARYTGISWINAEERDLENGLREFCARHFANPIEPSEARAHKDRFAHLLTQIAKTLRGRILIVIDNIPVEDTRDKSTKSFRRKVLDLLRSAPKSVVTRFDFLLTSRQEFEPNFTVNMAVDRLITADAVELFRSRANRPDLDSNDSHVLRLVDGVLGGHALSITLVASLARENSIVDVTALISMVESKIVYAQSPLNKFELGDEYPASLFASFLIAFEAIPDQAKSLLMLFGLFRRNNLTVETIRNCARFMPEGRDGNATADIRGEFYPPAGQYKELNRLFRHSLVERIERATGSLFQVHLHEVIYDFVVAQWADALQSPDEKRTANLRDLELKLTLGACAYASERINEEKISFVDIETLVGFLLPMVHKERGFLPARARVEAALDFWFAHFKFQNFVYDTGLQETLVQQLEKLLEYLTESGLDDARYLLVLKKLIGHGYYADPLGDGGKLADALFNSAIEIARKIEDAPQFEKQQREVQWYKVFLLDHRSNLASKLRPAKDYVSTIRSDTLLGADLDEIEATLPRSLQTLDAPPALEECELLVRSAIYWGHRGNQDSFLVYRQLVEGQRSEDFNNLVADARRHYIYAANFRLLTLRIFRQGQFEQHLAKPIRKGEIPGVAPWLLDVSSSARQGFEAFTSLSQAIGDTAHQYRGAHFVSVIEFFSERAERRHAEILMEARGLFSAAKLLWEVSLQTLDEGEVPLKYRLWMASSYVLQEWLECVVSGTAIDSLDVQADNVRDRLREMQEGAKSGYHFGADEQVRQLNTIYRYVFDQE